MAVYLSLHETESDYKKLTLNSKNTPHAAYIIDTNQCYYTPEILPIGVGDVAYWDTSANVVKTTPKTKWSSDLGTPVGVVVIPEGFAPDGKARMISLKYATSAGTSSDSYVSMPWGGYGTDTSLTNYTKVPTTDNAGSTSTGSSDYGYLPSDKFTGIESYVDPKSKYDGYTPMIPSPYLDNDRTLNPVYKETISGNNALSDFGGSSNTQTLVGLGADYIAANACWNYKDGSSNLQWYLPAAGELGFLVARFKEINKSITTVGGSSVASNCFWSSSEYSSYYAYCVGATSGSVYDNNKDGNYYVRPFAVLP